MESERSLPRTREPRIKSGGDPGSGLDPGSLRARGSGPVKTPDYT